LVEQGIDSISLNPDSVMKTLLNIAQVEESSSAMDLIEEIAKVQ
jgi:pyruvate,water dikinase